MTECQKEKCKARQALMAAAEKLFVEKGYAAVSTREIADAADVNLGAIQYHFGSKAQLFTAVVKSVMEQRRNGDALSALEQPTETREQAAVQICRFICAMIEEIIQDKGNEMCRIMYRDAMSETALEPEIRETVIKTSLEEFMYPLSQQLRNQLYHFSPNFSEEEIVLNSQSIAGQCTFYFTHEVYIDRLWGKNFRLEPTISEVKRHVCRFSLLGLGASQELIEASLKAISLG